MTTFCEEGFSSILTNSCDLAAALLIQGSACIYSKKVEYLYNLLYQTLDMITAKKCVGAPFFPFHLLK